jgi:hypothetical protein
MAVTGALLWDGKKFCAYLCPVGRITGLYSNFSPIEVRARNSRTCQACTTEDCLHGAGSGYPCPTGISLKTVEDATDCTMCSECVKSCAKQNVAVNLRPFGSDLQAVRKPRVDVAWFALILLALTLFHGLSMTAAWDGFAPGQTSLLKWMGLTFGTPRIVNFSVAMLLSVALPIALYWLCCRVSAAWAGEGPSPSALFVAYAYSLLPLALFYHLAHNLMHLLMEGGAIVSLASDPLGTGADFFGTRGVQVGSLVSQETLWLLQVVLVAVGHVFAIVIAHGIGHRLYANRSVARRSLVPVPAMMVAVSVCGLWLMHMDMTMRLGRM